MAISLAVKSMTTIWFVWEIESFIRRENAISCQAISGQQLCCWGDSWVHNNW
jgi:hypothetical protein